MHIPDGMLETRTWATAWAASAGAIAFASRQVRRHLDDSRTVLMAVLAALVFALQMLNFPVAGGTSGHFTGAAAAAIILGPWAAMLVMSTVLVIQALIFADGGIAALGANMLNMAIIAPLVGWAVYSALARVSSSRAARIAGAFAGAWLAVEASALAAAVEIWASGRAPLGLLAGSMGFWHALIGLGEGAITAGLIGYLLAVRPDLIAAEESASRPPSRRGLVALGGTAVTAALLSFAASAKPDGLASVARALGFAPSATATASRSPIPGYVVPGVGNAALAGILAALAGLLLAGAGVFALARAVRARPPRRDGA